ncbi:DUF3150 domain-containing protein [Azospirillum sp. sgz302134]
MELNNVLKDVDIFAIDVDAWSGTKVIDRAELLRAGAKLPPQLLASGGTKNVFDPQDLTRFNTFRRQGDRALEAVGVKVPLLGAYAVPKAAADALERELKTIKKRFYDYLENEFFANFEAKKRKWISKWPEHEAFILNSIDPEEVIRHKFKFAIGRFQLTSENLVGDTDIVQEVTKVSDRLLDEIAADADELFKVLEGRMTERTVQRRSLNRLERIRRKLFGFGFIDHAVIPMVEAIDKLIHRLPQEGMIAPEDFMEALAITLILCDPDKVRRHGFGAVTVDDELEALGVAPTPSQTVAPVPASTPAGTNEPTVAGGTQPAEGDLFASTVDSLVDAMDLSVPSVPAPGPIAETTTSAVAETPAPLVAEPLATPSVEPETAPLAVVETTAAPVVPDTAAPGNASAICAPDVVPVATAAEPAPVVSEPVVASAEPVLSSVSLPAPETVAPVAGIAPVVELPLPAQPQPDPNQDRPRMRRYRF